MSSEKVAVIVTTSLLETTVSDGVEVNVTVGDSLSIALFRVKLSDPE